MSDLIHVLSDAVANQIAAGEVIQRPASVVKELMENSLDAGASRINVQVKDAGKTLIQVSDNGKGMSENDARLCFERHATSKIKTAEDLFSIHTRGFRGEALASIGAVAEVILKTRQVQNELGIKVSVAGSVAGTPEAVQMAPGSTFQVRNLFYNIPARRKFLKSDQTEFRHIINEFNHVALTQTDVHFTLQHNGTEILNLAPANRRQRIVGIFGKALSNYLIPLESETSIIRIKGFIGKAEYARKTYGEQYFFVNGRYIKHPYFHKAVMHGYEQILAPDHIPSYFIFLETDPAHIDVNIHPTKTEVKFEEEKAIWKILLAAVKEAIGRNNLSPTLDFSKEGIIDIPVITPDTTFKAPVIETNPAYNPFEAEDSYRQTRPSKPYRDERFEGWEQLFDPMSSSGEAPVRHLQVKNKYIFSPVKSGVMVIDQRRAHERILFEELMEASKDRKPLSQQSLFPETVKLGPEDYQVCLEMMGTLADWGFDIRDSGNGSVIIHGMPAEMDAGGKKAVDTLEMMIEQFKSLEGHLDLEVAEKAARSAARSSAIQYGRMLNETEMQELTDRLFACSNPNYTPSGKLIVKILELDQLDEQFN